MSDAGFQHQQRRFAAYLRDPDTAAAPDGVEDRRLAIYRELVFSNVNGFLTQGFPVLHSLLPAARWHRLARAFLREHSCQTPYFLEIPEEFVRFLSTGTAREEGDPPFLLELAHYEWMELVLDAETTELPDEDIDPNGDLLSEIPCVSPLHVVLSYHYPVHKICAEYQPDTPLAEPVWLVVYRNRDDDVGFMEINAATARLLELMEEQPGKCGEELVKQLGEELQFPEPGVLAQFAGEILKHLRANDILLGTKQTA